MSLRSVANLALSCALLGAGIGCQTLSPMGSRTSANAGDLPRSHSGTTVILAAAFADPPAEPTKPAGEPAKSGEENRPEGPAKLAPAYSAPSEAIRQLILQTVVATTPSSSPQGGSVGRELAEANAAAPGLSAPLVSAGVAGFSGSPGLQEGLATALGPISPHSNLLEPARENVLTGPNGGCAALARGGFFGRSPSACNRAFGSSNLQRFAHGGARIARK